MASQVKKKRVVQRKSSTNAKKIVLERVIGNTVGHNASFSCNPVTGDIAYPAGCLVVIYNAKRNKQVRFLANKENKVISFLCYSSNGKYLAVGESGHRPAVAIWDTSSWQIVSELRGHKFGVSCGAFSPNLKYLVTVGFQHDGYLYLWDWRAQHTVACNKTTTEVCSVAFSEDGTYFVTAGLRHLKFWYLDPSGNFKSTDKGPRNGAAGLPNQIQLIDGRSGVLGAHRDATFVDVACGRGAASGYTYCVTATGMLCVFSPNRLMEKWVNLKTSRVFSLSVCEGTVACACADGVIRLFEHISLEYINTLPRPFPLGKSNAPSGEVQMSPSDIYPDVLAVRLSYDGQRVASIYTDRSFIIWDVRNPKKIGLSRSFMSHSACIWDIAICPDTSPFPEGSFITCSADNTIRVWNLGGDVGLNASMTVDDVNASFSQSVYSKELIHTIYVGNDYSAFKARTPDSNAGATPVVGEGGIRCIAVRPDGQQIASGDRQGNLRVYDTTSYSCVEFKEAHDAEILAMDFSTESKGEKACFLGTASRDRLVHIFDAAKSYDLAATLDDHSSSITALKFACNGTKLLTCSADKSIIFRTISYDESLAPAGSQSPPVGQVSIKRYHQATVPYGTLYDLDVDATQKYAVAVGQDKRLSIYNIVDGKVKRTYRATDPDAGDVLKVTLDPAGIYAATTCSNKVVRLYDFFSGECLVRLAGHSELITGVKFTQDCSRMISVAGDGCIFVWKLSAEFTKNIKARLAEQSLGRTDDVVTSTPANSSRQNPVPPNLSPIAVRLAADDTQDESFDSNILNDSVMPRFQFGNTGLPSWAKGSENPKQVEGSAPANNPRGRWAQHGDNAITLYSELSEEDKPVVKFDRADKRRLTIEPDSDLWGEPVSHTRQKSLQEEDGTIAIDVENNAENEPRRSKIPFSAEDDDAVLQGYDEDDGVGNLEDDDSAEENDSNEKDADTQLVYFAGPADDQSTNSAFRVEDKPDQKIEGKSDGLNEEEGEIDEKSKPKERDPQVLTESEGHTNDDLASFHDNMLRDNYENLANQHFTHNALRLSFSQRFLSKNQHPGSVEESNEVSLPGAKGKKAKEPLAREVEKTRELLAKLGPKFSGTRSSNSSDLSAAPSPSLQPQDLVTKPTPLPQSLESSSSIPYDDFDGSVTASAFPRSHSPPPATLPRPLSEYEQSLKSLSAAFRASMALFQEVKEAASDPVTSHVRNEFSSLFDQLQTQLGAVSTSTQTLPQTQQFTDPSQNLERYSDLIVDRVLQKLGSLDFSSKLLQSIQASQTISQTGHDRGTSDTSTTNSMI